MLIVGVEERVVEIDHEWHGHATEPVLEGMRKERDELGVYDNQVVAPRLQECAKARERRLPETPPEFLAAAEHGRGVAIVEERHDVAGEAVVVQVGQVLHESMAAARRLRRVPRKDEDLHAHDGTRDAIHSRRYAPSVSRRPVGEPSMAQAATLMHGSTASVNIDTSAAATGVKCLRA